MLRSTVDEDWDGYYVRHPQRGRLGLVDVFNIYTEHAQFHLSYFRRNLDAFKSTHA
jgi:pectate lyase